MKFSVKTLKLHHFKEVKNIFYDTFDLHDDPDFFAAWRNRNQRSSMGLFYRGTLIGFGLVCNTKLYFLAIARQFRGGGSGSMLLHAILSTMKCCHLTPVNDLRIISWYERHGFRISRSLRPDKRWHVPLKEPSKYKPHERWAISQPRHIMSWHSYGLRSKTSVVK